MFCFPVTIEGSPFDADKPDPVAEWANKNWTADKLDVREMKIPAEKMLGGFCNMAAHAPTVERLNELWVVNKTYLESLDSDAHRVASTTASNRRAFLSQEPSDRKVA